MLMAELSIESRDSFANVKPADSGGEDAMLVSKYPAGILETGELDIFDTFFGQMRWITARVRSTVSKNELERSSGSPSINSVER